MSIYLYLLCLTYSPPRTPPLLTHPGISPAPKPPAPGSRGGLGAPRPAVDVLLQQALLTLGSSLFFFHTRECGFAVGSVTVQTGALGMWRGWCRGLGLEEGVFLRAYWGGSRRKEGCFWSWGFRQFQKDRKAWRLLGAKGNAEYFLVALTAALWRWLIPQRRICRHLGSGLLVEGVGKEKVTKVFFF